VVSASPVDWNPSVDVTETLKRIRWSLAQQLTPIIPATQKVEIWRFAETI
jgi:hypothetical protein